MSEEQLTENEELREETPEEAAGEAEELISVKEQLAQARAQAQEYLDGWQRERAELANLKKRVERERAEMNQAARATIIARFLDVLDDFERAVASAPESLSRDGWFEGLLLVQRKFNGLLEAEGVTEIEAENQMFDPALHEAIMQEPSEAHAEGQIIEVVKKGYRLGERVVRPASVKVAG